jgi:hypothetical protein
MKSRQFTYTTRVCLWLLNALTSRNSIAELALAAKTSKVPSYLEPAWLLSTLHGGD